jgi:hypothetical protein
MDRRFLAVKAWPALLAVSLGALALGPAAIAADIPSDIDNWNMTEAVSQAGGGTQYHIGTNSSGWVQYRWLDSPNKWTLVSVNNCGDLALLGGPSGYAAADTTYHAIYYGPAATCFELNGRTQDGQGSMVNHDGRVMR